MPTELPKTNEAAVNEAAARIKAGHTVFPVRVLAAKEHVSQAGRTTHLLTLEVQVNEQVTPIHYYVPVTNYSRQENFLRVLLPHIYANGGDWEYSELVGRECQALLRREEWDSRASLDVVALILTTERVREGR